MFDRDMCKRNYRVSVLPMLYKRVAAENKKTESEALQNTIATIQANDIKDNISSVNIVSVSEQSSEEKTVGHEKTTYDSDEHTSSYDGTTSGPGHDGTTKKTAQDQLSGMSLSLN